MLKDAAKLAVGAVLTVTAFVWPQSQAQDPNKIAPETVRASEAGIGRLVTGVSGPLIEGGSFRLDAPSDAKATVIALTDVSCPVCQKYAPTLASLEDRFSKEGVRFVFVNSSSADNESDIKQAVKDHGFDGPYVWDPLGGIAAQLGAKTTAEVFLLDRENTLVYRGAVDDQYGIGYVKAAPQNAFLADAINSLLEGKRPGVEATTAPGCLLALEAKPMERDVTYYDQVARIMQRNCVQCHRTGGVAPFALDTYEKVENFKAMIQFVVERGTMPPWFAEKSEGHSPWANDRTLSEQDKQDIASWIKGGAPKGDPKDAPAPIVYDPTWSIGKPDVVYEIPRENQVQATGQMPYIHLRVPTDRSEDKWVQSMEVLPTDRAVVHHVLVFVIKDGKIDGKELFDLDESTGFFMGYVPGTSSVVFPEGQAKKLPKGATLLFQIHYTPNGKATTDRTRIALKFAESPPQHEVQVYGIVNRTFAIPPGAASHSDTQTLTVPRDVMLTAFMPHMHVRGKAMRYDIEYPDGRKETLLNVPHYDFNWQLTYRYAQPKFVPKGSKITLTGTFDNSADNPYNPDPTKTVRWGLQTTEEMLLGYVEFYVPGATPGEVLHLGGGN